jgi:hypothetical protein
LLQAVAVVLGAAEQTLLKAFLAQVQAVYLLLPIFHIMFNLAFILL